MGCSFFYELFSILIPRILVDRTIVIRVVSLPVRGVGCVVVVVQGGSRIYLSKSSQFILFSASTLNHSPDNRYLLN